MISSSQYIFVWLVRVGSRTFIFILFICVISTISHSILAVDLYIAKADILTDIWHFLIICID